MHDKQERPKRRHKAKISLAESEMLRCSDGFEFVCEKSEKLRVTFALDFCDRGGKTGQQSREVMTVRRCGM